MCAGIGAPGTLAEILRGYLGDRSAPERLAPDAVVRAGPAHWHDLLARPTDTT